MPQHHFSSILLMFCIKCISPEERTSASIVFLVTRVALIPALANLLLAGDIDSSILLRWIY